MRSAKVVELESARNSTAGSRRKSTAQVILLARQISVVFDTRYSQDEMGRDSLICSPCYHFIVLFVCHCPFWIQSGRIGKSSSGHVQGASSTSRPQTFSSEIYAEEETDVEPEEYDVTCSSRMSFDGFEGLLPALQVLILSRRCEICQESLSKQLTSALNRIHTSNTTFGAWFKHWRVALRIVKEGFWDLQLGRCLLVYLCFLAFRFKYLFLIREACDVEHIYLIACILQATQTTSSVGWSSNMLCMSICWIFQLGWNHMLMSIRTRWIEKEKVRVCIVGSERMKSGLSVFDICEMSKMCLCKLLDMRRCPFEKFWLRYFLLAELHEKVVTFQDPISDFSKLLASIFESSCVVQRAWEILRALSAWKNIFVNLLFGAHVGILVMTTRQLFSFNIFLYRRPPDSMMYSTHLSSSIWTVTGKSLTAKCTRCCPNYRWLCVIFVHWELLSTLQ